MIFRINCCRTSWNIHKTDKLFYSTDWFFNWSQIIGDSLAYKVTLHYHQQKQWDHDFSFIQHYRNINDKTIKSICLLLITATYKV